MKILLSPAKSLRDENWDSLIPMTTPAFIAHSSLLADKLKALSVDDISQLMNVSEKLAALNYSRFQKWNPELKDAVPAIHLFDGDVYAGFDIKTLSVEAAENAQKSIRILSGLYGVLQPYDSILPYRLEMGRPFPGKNGLYNFWKDKLTDYFMGEDVIYNLASTEYSKAVNLKLLEKNGSVIVEPRFEDQNPEGKFKVISFHAKRARGMMARWMVENPSVDITRFNYGGYEYQTELSSEKKPLFRRKIRE